MSRKEIRTHLFEVRAAPDGAEGRLRFTGYAAKFNTWSSDLGGFREQILPGAFLESLARDDVRCLLNHNPDRVLGRNRAGTLTLGEDESGLRFEVDAPDTGWARDLEKSVARGDINQCSFAFTVDAGGDEWVWTSDPNQLDERTIRRAKLFDVSIVTYPAYEDTEASVAARSREDALAERAKALQARTAENRRRLRKRLELKEKEI